MDSELSLDKEPVIVNLIKSACTKWREIGCRLGLSEKTLDQIHSQSDDPNQALHKIIRAWLNGKDHSKSKGVNWSCLIRALKHKLVNELELATTVTEFAKASFQTTSDPTEHSQPQASVPLSNKELFIKYLDHLVEATSDKETYSLAVELYCAGLIPREVRDDVLYTKSYSKAVRALKMYKSISVLLNPVLNKSGDVLVKVSSILCKQENEKLVKIAYELQGKDFRPIKLPVCQHNPPCCPSSIEKFQDHLKNKYLSQSKFQSTNAWPPTISVDYVNLQIIEATLNPASSKAAFSKKVRDIVDLSQKGSVEGILKISKMIELKDIMNFDVESNHKFVLIEGAPGIGKTTVANRICEEWAKGTMFREYDLVFYVPLRFTHMKIVNSLSELLQEYQHPDTFDPSMKIDSYIRECKGKGVLLLLDGWDELGKGSLDDDSFLPRLVRGDFINNMHCIVTSRPVATTTIRSCSFFPSTRIIQIVGFTKDNIETYVRLYFIKNPSFGESLLEKLRQYPNIMSACYVAINATIICYVFDQNDGVLPDTLTEVYHSFILHAIKRHITKNASRNENYCMAVKDELESICLQEIDEKRHELLLKLCELALEGVLTNNYSFRKRVMRKACNITGEEEFDGFGLVQLYDIPGSQSISYAYFLHLTIQEFLAAYTLSCKDERTVFAQLGKIFASGEYPFVTKFLYGLCGSQDKHKTALDSFVYTNTISQLLLMECIYESKDNEKCQYVAKRYSSVLTIKDQRLQPYQALCCGNVMLKSKQKWTIEWMNVGIGEDELRILYDCLKGGKIVTKVSCQNCTYFSKQAHDLMEEITETQSAELQISQ